MVLGDNSEIYHSLSVGKGSGIFPSNTTRDNVLFLVCVCVSEVIHFSGAEWSA
jgi:hypothetical protein